MKRTGVVCVLLVLLVGTIVAQADAAKRKPKEVTREAVDTYGMPWFSSPSTGEGCFGDGCVRFRAARSERWLTVEVTDVSGTPTAFEITQEAGSARTGGRTSGPFCGTSGAERVRLVPDAEVLVYVYAMGDVACPGSFGTSGTVRAVFSNLP